MTPRLTALAALAALAACSGPTPTTSLGSAARATDPTSVACRAEAERGVRYRDRGQVMRSDEYNARVGTTSYLGPQVMTDSIAQVYDRDRFADECVRGSRDAAPAPASAPARPAPARGR